MTIKVTLAPAQSALLLAMPDQCEDVLSRVSDSLTACLSDFLSEPVVLQLAAHVAPAPVRAAVYLSRSVRGRSRQGIAPWGHLTLTEDGQEGTIYRVDPAQAERAMPSDLIPLSPVGWTAERTQKAVAKALEQPAQGWSWTPQEADVTGWATQWMQDVNHRLHRKQDVATAIADSLVYPDPLLWVAPLEISTYQVARELASRLPDSSLVILQIREHRNGSFTASRGIGGHTVVMPGSYITPRQAELRAMELLYDTRTSVHSQQRERCAGVLDWTRWPAELPPVVVLHLQEKESAWHKLAQALGIPADEIMTTREETAPAPPVAMPAARAAQSAGATENSPNPVGACVAHWVSAVGTRPSDADISQMYHWIMDNKFDYHDVIYALDETLRHKVSADRYISYMTGVLRNIRARHTEYAQRVLKQPYRRPA